MIPVWVAEKLNCGGEITILYTICRQVVENKTGREGANKNIAALADRKHQYQQLFTESGRVFKLSKIRAG